MTLISNSVREEAAQLCSMMACFGEPISVTRATSLLHGIPDTEAVRTLVARVAVRAWDAAHRTSNRPTDAESIRDDYAEAEALLRCGWTPVLDRLLARGGK